MHDSAITGQSSGLAPHRTERGANDILARTADLPPEEAKRTENCSNKVVCLIQNIELSDDEYADVASLDFLPMRSSPLEHRKFIEKLMAIQFIPSSSDFSLPQAIGKSQIYFHFNEEQTNELLVQLRSEILPLLMLRRWYGETDK